MDFMSLVVTLFLGYIIIYLQSLDFGEDTSKQPRAFLCSQMLEEEITFWEGCFFVVYCTSLLHKFIESLLLQSKTKSKYEAQSSYLNISGPIFSYIP
jgi:hypothetical protein